MKSQKQMAVWFDRKTKMFNSHFAREEANEMIIRCVDATLKGENIYFAKFLGVFENKSCVLCEIHTGLEGTTKPDMVNVICQWRTTNISYSTGTATHISLERAKQLIEGRIDDKKGEGLQGRAAEGQPHADGQPRQG